MHFVTNPMLFFHITQNQDNIGDLLGGHLLGNPLPQPNPFGAKPQQA